VRTYVQSGNVVCRTAKRDMGQLAVMIEGAIEREFGFRPAAIVRTAAELKDVISRNPFAGRDGIEPSKLIVTFLASAPGREAREKVLALKTDPEEVRLDGREMYVWFPNGMGRTKLPVAGIEKTLKTPGTGRNWNTVTKLLEMAEALEAATRL
jgi:uncharacterized protein (DUF1697 family)